MPDHRIRLLAGWWIRNTDQPDLPPRAIDLPINWSDEFPEVVTLSRKFGCPPIDTTRESITLEFLKIPGLIEIRLNGVDLVAPPENEEDWLVPILGPLLRRNELTLKVKPARLDLLRSRQQWGMIALRIGSGAT